MSSRETPCRLKISINLQMLLVAFTHLNIGLSFDTSLAINVEKYLMCLVGTQRPTVFIQEQQSILFLKPFIKNKASSLCCLKESFSKCKVNISS
jgi:hypothetical protein